MSFTIEYNKQIFHIENENKERIYFLFIRQGDNNVYDANGLRAKSWKFVKAGTEKELWKEIGCRLGYVNGGSLQKAVGFGAEYYTEEDYIKQYRSKFRNSKPLETMLSKFSIEAFIYLREEFEKQEHKATQELLQSFISKYEMKNCGHDYYDESKMQYRHRISEVDTLKDFLLNLPNSWGTDYMTGYSIDKH